MPTRLSRADAKRLGIEIPGESGIAAPPKRDQSFIQSQLYGAIKNRYPEAVAEYPCIPGRRFRLDVAIPRLKIAVESDGWAWHGRVLRDFLRDREKRNLLAAGGWLVFAFTARSIRRDLYGCVELVDRAVLLREAEQTI